MNNKKHRKDIIENAPRLKLLPQTSRLAKCIIVKVLTIRQSEENKKRREENKQNGKKKPTRDDQAYNDETVYHIRKSTNKITTAIATVENVQDNMEFSLANYQWQPLLTNIIRYQRHDDQENEPMSMLTNIEDFGEETIIGGLRLEQEADKLDFINEEA
jgi:negative regulator of genetic competence, sporulation and motility